MIPRTARSTLFPYTTLFRSVEVFDGEVVTLIGANGAGKSTTLRSINGLNRPRKGSITFRDRDITSTDRKSTRLNSSHTVISYAVFCLKKKNASNTKTLPLLQ